MAFYWEKERRPAWVWVLTLSGCIIPIIFIGSYVLLVDKPSVLIIMIPAMIASTCAAFILINTFDHLKPSYMISKNPLSEDHVIEFHEKMTDDYGPPFTFDTSKKKIELYFMFLLSPVGFEYDIEKGILKTRIDDKTAREALDRIDNELRLRGGDDIRPLQASSLRNLQRFMVTRSNQMGTVRDIGETNWKKNSYNTWMMAVVATWFVGGIFIFAVATVLLSTLIDMDPRISAAITGIIIVVVVTIVIMISAKNTGKKGTFRSPDMYRMTDTGIQYRFEMTNKVTTVKWDQIKRIDISPILKVVRVEMKDGYNRDPLLSVNIFKINEIRFLMTRKERRTIKDKLPDREMTIS